VKTFALFLTAVSLTACGPAIKTERLSLDEGDEQALTITDEWMLKDTQMAIQQAIEKFDAHRGFQKYLAKLGHEPRLFIAEVQNDTSEAYFPIADMNDELLNKLSESGDFELIDAAARDRLLKEITYQNDGMVKQSDIKKIGKASGAELLIFGAVRMQPKSLKGRTIKEYTVNLRMTDIENGKEVARVRITNSKYSQRSGTGW
jgi:hypothetical protein